MKRDDGGQAFSRSGFSGPGGFSRPVEGMSMLDYFAGQALAGNLAAMNPGMIDEDMADAVAKGCYMAARAMLAERARTTEDAS